MNKEFLEVENKIKERLEYFNSELQKIRGGRASANTIEDIVVDYFGSKQPVKALGSIGSLDAQTLVVEPWDKNSAEAIATAITKSQNGLFAVVDGDRVRVPFPSLSQERREEFIRLVGNKTEEAKVQLRRLRDGEIKNLKKQEEAKEISKDYFLQSRDKLDEMFKKYAGQMEEKRAVKEKELSQI